MGVKKPKNRKGVYTVWIVPTTKVRTESNHPIKEHVPCSLAASGEASTLITPQLKLMKSIKR